LEEEVIGERLGRDVDDSGTELLIDPDIVPFVFAERNFGWNRNLSGFGGIG
jgi:hypothetical protein